MKIYTKTGDAGDTGLFGGVRVSKADPRVEAYGDVDELNSLLGAARCLASAPELRDQLNKIQENLFCVGAELASNPEKPLQKSLPIVEDREVSALEEMIDHLEAQLAPLTTFILPGGSAAASTLHIARTACRRAERKVVALSNTSPIRPQLLRYLNRLSDLLFVMARHENKSSNIPDIPWTGRK